MKAVERGRVEPISDFNWSSCGHRDDVSLGEFGFVVVVELGRNADCTSGS